MAKYRKLSRTSSQRKALIRGQVTALIANGKIVTTEAAMAAMVSNRLPGMFLLLWRRSLRVSKKLQG